MPREMDAKWGVFTAETGRMPAATNRTVSALCQTGTDLTGLSVAGFRNGGGVVGRNAVRLGRIA